MEIAKPQIAQRIKEAREWKGISQVAMAKYLDMARQTYLDLESGKTEPRISTLLKLAELTDRSLGWFVTDYPQQGNDEAIADDIWQLTSLYNQLPEPLRSQLLASNISQLKACVGFLSQPKLSGAEEK